MGSLSHHNARGVVNTSGATADSHNTVEILAWHPRRRWRIIRPKIFVVARFARLFSRARRLADLRRVLGLAAGVLTIDELVVQEIAAYLSLLPLLPPHETSECIIPIDLDHQPVVGSEQRGRL